MAKEKELRIYEVVLEHSLEPGYSRRREFVIASSGLEAASIKRAGPGSIIFGAYEFKLPGYKIHANISKK